MLRTPANVLLLDEPTNDLDVETLSALEAALEDFAGCAVIISHDRWFLNRIATHILAFEGDSHVANGFEGVAVRFRQQINENSKMLCWHHVVPEMNHNELLGWRTNARVRAFAKEMTDMA